MDVGTDPVSLGKGGCLVQNLGPDDLFIGEGSAVTDETGVRLAAGEAVAVGFSNDALYCVSANSSDVRVLPRGMSISATSLPA